jgi:catechol 2,3-dioxygenase-like lactoylglutathione lyase family enzyme
VSAAAPDGIPVKGFNELVLEVLDLERAVDFYTETFGLELADRWEGRAWFKIGDGARLGLWTPQVGIADGRGGVHVHYAMHIPDDAYQAAVARLRERGYDPHEENFEENGLACYVTDPDGNVVELWTWGG